MAVEVVMPAMEWGQETATLVRWLKAEGDLVRGGEPLMEIETDKVTVEIEAPGSGVLSGLAAGPGDEVPVGRVIALLLAEGESAAPGAPAAAKLRPASPKARRLAADGGLELAALAGSGPGGAVRTRDVQAAIAAGAAPAREEYAEIRLEGVRKVTAARLQASHQAAPHISLEVPADMTEALRLLGERRAEGGRGTVTALLAAHLGRCLLEHPRLNAHLVGESIRLYRSVHLGIAVALDDGLIVPVLQAVERKSLAELQAELDDLTARARAGALKPSEVRGGTFTLSNLGMFGVERFTAILNPPEVGLLAAGAIRETPVGVGGAIALRPVLRLTLIADHRAVDGAVAATFLGALREGLERPRLEGA